MFKWGDQQTLINKVARDGIMGKAKATSGHGDR
jgi:hypothetical protein